MTYYGVNEMAASFRTVRNNTIRMAEDIPEEQFDFRATPDTRSIRELLNHIAFCSGVQYHIHSNRVEDLKNVNFGAVVGSLALEEAKPRTKAEVIATLAAEGDKFCSFLERLSESFLAEPVALPPGADRTAKSRFEMLLSAKEHEMHHRAQLTTLQRLVGIVPHLTRQMQERMSQQAAR